MRINRSKGFTLIELLIVIAIIGILAAVLIPQLMRARSVAVDRAAEGYGQNVYTAANAYLAEYITAAPGDVTATCVDGYDANDAGQYSTEAPSFDATGCEVYDNGDGSVGVAVTYTGGTEATGLVQINTDENAPGGA